MNEVLHFAVYLTPSTAAEVGSRQFPSVSQGAKRVYEHQATCGRAIRAFRGAMGMFDKLVGKKEETLSAPTGLLLAALTMMSIDGDLEKVVDVIANKNNKSIFS